MIRQDRCGQTEPRSGERPSMKKLLISILTIAFCLNGSAEQPAKAVAGTAMCPVDAKAADAKFATTYEEVSYGFCSEACLTKWKADRAASIYEQIGGKAAMEAAVNRFYEKVLADARIKHFFDDVDMVRQKAKQRSFLSAAFGAPTKYEGRDMRKAHAKIPGLNDTHFNAVAENLQSTLVELKVKQELIDKIMAIAGSVRADVLNK